MNNLNDLVNEFEKMDNPDARYQRALISKYNPTLFMWVFKKDLLGSLAKWAIKQSPYLYPQNLITVLDKFADHIEPYFTKENSTVGMRKFKVLELEDFIEANLKTIPEYLDWNERINGRDGVGVVTRFDDDFEKDLDDDFIDLGALVRNVAHDIYDTGSPFEETSDLKTSSTDR